MEMRKERLKSLTRMRVWRTWTYIQLAILMREMEMRHADKVWHQNQGQVGFVSYWEGNVYMYFLHVCVLPLSY